MATEIKLPELGENVEEGEVIDVRVGPGEEVREGQPLLEIEAEKSTVELPSPVAGRITEMLVKKGDRVRTGQGLCRIEAGDGKQATAAKPKEAAAPAEKPVTKQPQ